VATAKVLPYFDLFEHFRTKFTMYLALVKSYYCYLDHSCL